MLGVLRSDRILKLVTQVVYGLLPDRLVIRYSHRARWILSGLSAAMLVIHWCAFSYVMNVARLYWSHAGAHGQSKIPLETLLLVILLDLSGVTSYTLVIFYFYSPNHHFAYDGKVKVYPHFTFAPMGRHIELTLSHRSWLFVNVFVFLGSCGIVFLLYCAFGLNVFFDYPGINSFAFYLTGPEMNIYFISVAIIFWGFFNVVVACCIFYVVCKDIVVHIDFTRELIINDARDFRTAKSLHEALLKYTEHTLGTIRAWFILHNIFLIFITLTTIVSWFVALQDVDKKDMVRVIVAQIAGSLVIAFKYAFPFLAAGHVTTKFDTMYKAINTTCDPEVFQELDVFMSYCMRCQAGFKIGGLKITAKLALLSLLSCFVGFFKLYQSLGWQKGS